MLFGAGSSVAGLTIMITPEWHEIDVQKMPMMVNVLTAEDLDSTATADTLDLQYQVPGFVFKTNSVLGQPYLRGVGSDIISAGSDASVATFKDGIYQTRAANAIQNLYDVERVEVLKGPQGVHLGRNVVGGAVSVISKEPEFFPSAYGDILYGSFNKLQLRGAVNQPLANPDLTLRVAGFAKQRDGYSENQFLGRELDNEDYYAGRAKLRYKPSVDLDVVFSVEHSREDSSRGAAYKLDPTIGSSGGLSYGGTVPADPRVVNHNVEAAVDITTSLYSAKIKKRLASVNFLSTTGYQKTDGKLALDLDNTEVDYSANFPHEVSKAFTQEFRLSSAQDSAIDWIAGVFFMYEEAYQMLDVHLPLFNFRNRPVGEVDTISYAVFAQTSYQFNQRWQSTFGIRENYDRRQLDYRQTIEDPLGALGAAGTTVITMNDSKRWDAVTPEFGLEYTPSSNTLLYGNLSRGFKAGGYNTSALQSAFDPEYLWAYELGVKTQPGGSLMQVNSAIFFYDYKDMQVMTLPVGAPAGSLPSVVNAAEATIKGLDLDVISQVTDKLQLSLGVTLLDAKIDKFVSVDPNNPAVNADRSGNPLPQAPDSSINFGAERSWLSDTGTLKAQLGYRYQSDMYFNPFKDSAVKQEGYGLVNASLRFDSFKQRWYMDVFVKNLTDKLYAETIIRQDPLVGTVYSWGAPRTFGVRFGYKL